MFNVVLVEPEIPPNTGNIGRLCLATGSTLHLIKPLGFSIGDRELKRAGLDYWKEVEVRLWDSFDALRQSVESDARFFFLTTKSNRAYWDVAFQPGDFLVFGREMGGRFCCLGEVTIPTELRVLCDEIPASEFREDVSSTELRGG